MNDQEPQFRPAILIGVFIALFVTGFLRVPEAAAVPSYARQTGFACKSCHMTPPELTALGRAFKLNGYTMPGAATVTSKRTGKQSGLMILETLPLSVFFETSFSSTQSPQPTTQNGSFQFPQDVSLFLAGAWSQHVGSFVQLTYHTSDDHFSWDNTDIRYANATKIFAKDFVYGITLNNNPTVEDLWNSTPAFGYPFILSSAAPLPTAAAIINGPLAQDVAGIGGYGMWDNHLYLAGAIYRSQHEGAPEPTTGLDSSLTVPFAHNIRGVAPYWRASLQETTKNNYLEVGTYGMWVKSTPGAITGPEDSFTDVAADFQYDRTIPSFGGDILSFRGTYIHENSSLLAEYTNETQAASLVRHHLNTVQANAEYHFGDRYSLTGGFFSVTGTPDPLFYAQSPLTGSANGDPRSNGYIANISWWPVQNIDLAFQYTGYLRFNGAGINYDGSGRNAGANNTVYLLARFVF